MTSDHELSAISYGAVLRARIALVAALAAICVAVAAIVVLRAPHHYTASADVLVSPVAAGDDDFIGVQVLRDSGVAPSSNVLTVARLVKTPETAALVAKQPGIHQTAPSLLGDITVSPLSQTSLVAISASAKTAHGAAAIANAFARATIERRTATFQTALRPIVSRLEAQAGALAGSPSEGAALPAIEGRLAVLKPLIGAQDPTLDVFDVAEPPVAAAGRHVGLSLLAALLGGLLLGVVVALLRELVDRRVRADRDIPASLGAPVLGRVPARPDAATFATAFRDVRARLFDGAEAPRAIVVAEAATGDGATTTAVQLARALARSRQRVALLDLDFDRPAVADAFGVVPPDAGFDAVFGDGDVERAVVTAPGTAGRLWLVLPTISGARAPKLARLDPEAIRRAIARLHEHVEVVVVDTAPLEASSDALLAVAAVRRSLVSVRFGTTSRSNLVRLAHELDEAGAAVSGLVVADATGRRRVRAALERLRAVPQRAYSDRSDRLVQPSSRAPESTPARSR
jgi:capsular polysaccharide biosynthesis protein/MinD-like ATPase involved in chromosome partitioning or flagellar assembly